jgi:hypothetical protein
LVYPLFRDISGGGNLANADFADFFELGATGMGSIFYYRV